MTVLGGLAPKDFLRKHWQKKPLLVRGAIPGFDGIAPRDALLELATRADVTSRLVIKHPKSWERHDGPFGALDPSMLPAKKWTLLVHGVEGLVEGGWELLRRFDFIPAARVDDLMVSYAADGGGVGPHEDDYDVFLVQGPGRRRWQISTRGDHALDSSAAIKVLQRFEPEEEWVLEPGDLLYLPPGVAHHGVAVGPCFTYSIGFLAPTHAELAQAFMGFLGAPGRYADPDLAPAKDPLVVGDAMIARVGSILKDIRWSRRDVEEFLGRYLTMPKRAAAPPGWPMARDAFARRLRGPGRLALALRCRALARGDRLFLDGASFPSHPLLRELLASRGLDLPTRAPASQLYEWYVAGKITIASPAPSSPRRSTRRAAAGGATSRGSR
jgi:50S ribosomal protein L16 3-hydroxylase